HMVNFTFKEQGNDDLIHHNRLNKRMYELCSYASGRTYTNDFLTSSTSLGYEEYGDTPWHYVASCGFDQKEWQKVHRLYVLRAAVMTHCLRNADDFD
ncbi:tyrosine decarboxylase, partial [Enterobacter hormaechei]|nr:tyrosine decarboxylase [Enterobacter hormaechei]